ncbi:MAG TPA: SLC13 family permease [Blastocatellia bacterium]|nr:SLC13 family permease [Blastocatellia bacterium]
MQIAIVFAILAAAVVLFVTEALAIDLIAILMLLGLTLTGVVDVKEGLSGFSDPAVVTIAGFFVISAALFNTGVVEAIGRRLHSVAGSNKTIFLVILMLTGAALASFLSNVVTTAVLMPAVFAISRRMKQPVSRFLMPLSFGAVLGGKCTLVGSSTNLAVNSILPKYGMPPFTLFEFTPLGIPLAIAGTIFMTLVGSRLLPKHEASEFDDEYVSKDFVTEVVILPDSPLSDKTLGEADFRGMYDLQILGIVRGGERKLPHREAKLKADDVLLVKGKIDQILSIKDAQGLGIKSDNKSDAANQISDRVIVEAILSPNSAFGGKTLKEIRFGSRYNADVLAIYRHHRALHEKLSGIRLDFGDVLVIQGNSENINQLRQDPNFLTLEDIEHTPLRRNKAIWAVGIFLLSAIIAGAGVMPIALVALASAAAMMLTRCITVQEAYEKIEWTAIILIAATIPLGIAMEKTGAAKILADFVTQYLGFGGPMVVLAGFFIFTVLLTQPMANAACALILAPIAINVANQLQVNPRAFAITISVAASCTFPTPLEPVTAIVYGPGKYRFSDYVKVGGLLTLVVMIMTLLIVPIFWPFR